MTPIVSIIDAADQLSAWAAAAASEATTTADYGRVVVSTARAQHLARMARIVRQGAHELASYRTQGQPKVKAAPVRKPASMGARAFWTAYSEAVNAISQVYDDRWAVTAPSGETVLVMVPAPLRSYKTERGTIVRWRSDHRMPGPAYWPGGKLPEGITTQPDYPRHDPANPTGPRDAKWHRDHGYVQRCTAAGIQWLHPLEAHAFDARADQIEADRIADAAD